MGTRAALDQNLRGIRDDILRLVSLVSQAVERSVDAFHSNDPALARQVVEGDDAIDGLHHKLEESIISTLALQQPMARDLRGLIAALLITNELERMGDYAEGIGRTVLRRGQAVMPDIPPQLRSMQQTVLMMIEGVMNAYLEEDPDKAREAAARDDDLDHSYKDLFNILVNRMGAGELPVENGTYVLWAGHNLERIGDRVTNISERIIYAQTGDIGGLNPKGANRAAPHE